MLFPQRALEKKKKFSYTDTSGKFFQTPVGQEADKYDEDLKKAMGKYERGLIITKTKVKD